MDKITFSVVYNQIGCRPHTSHYVYWYKLYLQKKYPTLQLMAPLPTTIRLIGGRGEDPLGEDGSKEGQTGGKSKNTGYKWDPNNHITDLVCKID